MVLCEYDFYFLEKDFKNQDFLKIFLKLRFKMLTYNCLISLFSLATIGANKKARLRARARRLAKKKRRYRGSALEPAKLFIKSLDQKF